MRKELIAYLVCPVSQESLVLENAVTKGDEIISGTLSARRADLHYPIVDGVPVLLTPRVRKDTRAWDEWARQWKSKHFQFDPDAEDLGIPRTQQRARYHLDSFDMRGKIVLESGCGGGRLTPAFYSEAVQTYICLDISSAIYHARDKHKGKKNIHFVRGDLSCLPFRSGTFDYNMILGVIQHSADMQRTSNEMARVLKSGGLSVASVYMTPRNVFVRFKVWYCDVLRRTFRWLHLPDAWILAWARLSVLAFNGPFLFRPLAWAFYQQAPYNRSDKFTWMLNYDFYHANTYQYTLTRDQTLQMFLYAGLYPVLESKESPNSYVLQKRV